MERDRQPLDGPATLRWELADTSPAQGALFEPVRREVGRGEFRGMEFLHVHAKRIINEVKGGGDDPFLPFRFTINPYRGCSHACTYCMIGDTPILMADGRTKLLADVAVGDFVYGTEGGATYRHYAPTEVKAHWRTVKSAYRVVLEDGTELVASGDHRFLTDRGWKHVVGAEHGQRRRPHLTLNNALVGVGGFAGAPLIHGTALESDAKLKVVAIEPLGVDLPMYDITTGTGDFIANGVVSHNCFARPTHEYLGLGIGVDFDQRIVVKVNAVERLRAELSPARWGGHLIAMGTNTDPYQRAEGKYRLTQGIVRELAEAGNAFSILTKSTLVLRDLDLLVGAAKRTDVRVNLSIGTLDDEVWRSTEPGTPHPRQRLRAVEQLNAAGVPCGVLVAPIIPGLSDDPEQLAEVATACVRAGAVSVSTVLLHLRPGVKEHFLGELERSHPHLLARYRKLYRGAYAARDERRKVSDVVHAAVRAAGGLPAARMDARHLVGQAPATSAPAVPVNMPGPARPRQLDLGLG